MQNLGVDWNQTFQMSQFISYIENNYTGPTNNIGSCTYNIFSTFQINSKNRDRTNNTSESCNKVMKKQYLEKDLEVKPYNNPEALLIYKMVAYLSEQKAVHALSYQSFDGMEFDLITRSKKDEEISRTKQILEMFEADDSSDSSDEDVEDVANLSHDMILQEISSKKTGPLTRNGAHTLLVAKPNNEEILLLRHLPWVGTEDKYLLSLPENDSLHRFLVQIEKDAKEQLFSWELQEDLIPLVFLDVKGLMENQSKEIFKSPRIQKKIH